MEKNDGADLRKIASVGGRIEWLAWSPDGATLRFSTNGKLREISADGSNLPRTPSQLVSFSRPLLRKLEPEWRHLLFPLCRPVMGLR